MQEIKNPEVKTPESGMIKPEKSISDAEAKDCFISLFKNLFSHIEKDNSTYSDLNSMKQNMNMTYKEIKENKPPRSPNIAKWFDNGGSIREEAVDGKPVWTDIH